ncbi:ABC transporter ATP-binding protein [Microtetraspora sp. NBRC 16547]|uniref:ABC transporter ATP-binding protein n=1 Tax=Microtetraspora sp. NBRC 16547 TaxID=3030993 RepID=UPI0024A4F84F|nr:ABC transporter ATP-binding protein [Microtetraspora sp. NBRC 16547]GLW99388.1 nitrate ABC transporter ATP-binding protein [Microtetraspora sp. NBRC 16547]
MTATPLLNAPGEARGLAIDFEHVNHSFIHGDRAVRVLDDFNLNIEPSQFVSIVGPSGCGKTTALSMTGGLLRAREGSVRLDGREVTSTSADVAFLFARDALMPWRRVRSNVELGLEVRGVPKAERRERATAWLRRVRLHEFAESDVLHLSQGMRQRVAIARTLAQSPRVVLMDEPFAALDAQTRALQQEEFIRLWEAERPTVIFVTHDLEEAILLSDRVILMASRPGRIVADMTIDLERPRTQEMRSSERFRELVVSLYDQLRHEVDVAEARRQESGGDDD